MSTDTKLNETTKTVKKSKKAEKAHTYEKSDEPNYILFNGEKSHIDDLKEYHRRVAIEKNLVTLPDRKNKGAKMITKNTTNSSNLTYNEAIKGEDAQHGKMLCRKKCNHYIIMTHGNLLINLIIVNPYIPNGSIPLKWNLLERDTKRV